MDKRKTLRETEKTSKMKQKTKFKRGDEIIQKNYMGNNESLDCFVVEIVNIVGGKYAIRDLFSLYHEWFEISDVEKHYRLTYNLKAEKRNKKLNDILK